MTCSRMVCAILWEIRGDTEKNLVARPFCLCFCFRTARKGTVSISFTWDNGWVRKRCEMTSKMGALM